MRDDILLTFDLGTTRLKVAAFAPDGSVVGQTARRNTEYSAGNRAWQSAKDWWACAAGATTELIAAANIDKRQVKGISLSGRAGAGVFLDAQGDIVAEPWSDDRHGAALRELLAHHPANSAAYGPTLIAKAQWLRDNCPADFERVRHAMYGKDLLLFRLTGICATDPSSGPDGAWDQTLLRDAGIDSSILPAVLNPWEIAGTLTNSAATALGLIEGIPVATGAHDGICANIGANAIAPGRYALTLGTHAVIRSVEREFPDGARRFYGYPSDRHVIGGNALYAGRALDWFIDQRHDSEIERDAVFSELDRAGGSIEPGAGGITFLPFLRGRIAPTRQPSTRAAFHGLSLTSGNAEQYRAILEGTGFALREVHDQLEAWIGPPSYIGVTGSGAKSELWLRILASILGSPLSIADASAEGRGAAILCATALGYYPSVRDAAANMVSITRLVEPDPAWREQYAERFAKWQTVAATIAELDAET